MRRRIVWTTAALAVLLVLPAAPATAAQSSLVAPDDDVTRATAIEVELERDFGAERFSEVHASLRRDGERLGRRIQLVCVEGCEPTDRTALFAPADDERFDPATGAPFDAEGPLPNGGYVLRIDLLKDSNFQSDETFEHDLHLAVRPTAPEDLAASVEDGEVELTWTPSPEPDVDTYRLERHDGDDWETVVTTAEPAGADEPGEGEHRYRVVAERPDGRDGTLTTASDEVTAEVVVEDESAGGDDGNDGGNDDGDGNGNGDRNGEPEGVEASDAGGEAPDGDHDAGDDASSSEPRNSSSSGGTQAPRTGGNGSGGVPGIGEGNGSADDGDGDYAEELDYGEVEPDRPDDDVQIATPSGWRGSVDRILDAERIAVPIATGLVMTAAGLHLWRWLRIPV